MPVAAGTLGKAIFLIEGDQPPFNQTLRVLSSRLRPIAVAFVHFSRAYSSVPRLVEERGLSASEVSQVVCIEQFVVWVTVIRVNRLFIELSAS